VRLFLDTSVLLAACGSTAGASSDLFRFAKPNAWSLLTCAYALDEVDANLPDMQPSAAARWAELTSEVAVVDDVLTLDRPVVFEPAKDRPILFAALAWADLLLTLDHKDFGPMMQVPFYGLRVMTPGAFLIEQRDANVLRQ
jgi:predicted nucleic acid-binding protein